MIFINCFKWNSGCLCSWLRGWDLEIPKMMNILGPFQLVGLTCRKLVFANYRLNRHDLLVGREVNPDPHK